MRTIDQVLDQAKRAQNVASDYKLALTLGIGESALNNYRKGRSLPDEKAVSKLAAAIGEKPDLLLVEIQVQRSKSIESKAMWSNLAKRLQSGFARVNILFVLAIFSIAVCAAPALVSLYSACVASDSLYIMLSRTLKRWTARIVESVKKCKAGSNVPRNAHSPAFPAP